MSPATTARKHLESRMRQRYDGKRLLWSVEDAHAVRALLDEVDALSVRCDELDMLEEAHAEIYEGRRR